MPGVGGTRVASTGARRLQSCCTHLDAPLLVHVNENGSRVLWSVPPTQGLGRVPNLGTRSIAFAVPCHREYAHHHPFFMVVVVLATRAAAPPRLCLSSRMSALCVCPRRMPANCALAHCAEYIFVSCCATLTTHLSVMRSPSEGFLGDVVQCCGRS